MSNTAGEDEKTPVVQSNPDAPGVAERPAVVDPQQALLFQVKLYGSQLDAAQIENLAAAIRSATTEHVPSIDFGIRELTQRFSDAATTETLGCGGGCRAG